ncbi:LPO_1073/Vpar_1526 family protein [Nocardia sp. NPDC050697]|uniref:LPO_1073/Vpar_1526 family protein n=1 Tax=Nocardia sp. NPDC050697 TaxID=3155158 RepID=UPI0033EF6394
MTWFRQGQTGGDYSRQIQAAQNVYISEGVKPDEVVRISHELIRAELDRFTQTARTEVERLSLEFLENYMMRQSRVAPESVESLKRPDMQRTLQSAQISFTSCGDENLGQVLVDLLVELSRVQPRDFYAIAIAEAVALAPKVTTNQLDAMAFVYFVRNVEYQWEDLAQMRLEIARSWQPFFAKLDVDRSDLLHLASIGAGSFDISGKFFGEQICEQLPGLFTNGYKLREIPRWIRDEDLIMPAIRNPKLYQLKAVDTDELLRQLELALLPEHGISPYHSLPAEAIRILKGNPILESLCKEDLAGPLDNSKLVHSYCFNLFDGFELSVVGAVIAHTHIESVMGRLSNKTTIDKIRASQ